MDAKTIQEMSEREVFAKVFRQTLSSVFWFSVGAVVIVLVSLALPKIAVGLFVIYAFFAAVNALWVLVSVILPGLITTPAAIFRGREAMSKEVRMTAGAIIRIVDVGVGLTLSWYLYKRLF